MSNYRSIMEGEIYNKAYALDNYHIVDDHDVKQQTCLIIFSSAGIYYPNTEEALERTILKKDRYEWWNVKNQKVSRYIFVRDVSKVFYIEGINQRYSSIESVIKMLEKLTQGYDVITLGSSAGAYMAILSGCILQNCKYVLDFSGYYNLNILDSEKWPYLHECRLSKDKSRYFDLRKIVESRKCKIFRFYPALAKEDAEQTKQILDFNVNIFSFRSKIHGIPFSKEALYDLIKLDSEEIEDIWKSLNNKKFVSKLSFYSKIKKSWAYGLKVYIREITNKERIRFLLKKLKI